MHKYKHTNTKLEGDIIVYKWGAFPIQFSHPQIMGHNMQKHKHEYANTKLEGDDDSRTTEAPFKFNAHIPPSPITNAN